MITITDPAHIKTTATGQVLDRVSVVVYTVDVRERTGSPVVRFDLAYGYLVGAEFRAWSYEDRDYTVPYYVEPANWGTWSSSNAGPAANAEILAMVQQHRLLSAVIHWAEATLIALDYFGAGAILTATTEGVGPLPWLPPAPMPMFDEGPHPSGMIHIPTPELWT